MTMRENSFKEGVLLNAENGGSAERNVFFNFEISLNKKRPPKDSLFLKCYINLLV
jgi:hypothetical protein